MARLEVEILTLFPRMCTGYLGESILGKAQEAGYLGARVTDIREHAAGKHRVADDAPYGGGAGMVMKPEPLIEAIEASRERLPGAWVVLLGPGGQRLDQAMARRLANHGKLILVCGRYEGVDERVRTAIDMEVSLGDFVLTGGEVEVDTGLVAPLGRLEAHRHFLPIALDGGGDFTTDRQAADELHECRHLFLRPARLAGSGNS